MSSAQHVNLVSGDVLFEAGARISELYFINTGMASLLSTTTEGNTIEVGMVGHEGLVGAALLLKNPQMPYRSVMQISGHVTKIPARPLVEEFNKNPDFRNVILRYLHFMLSQIS